VPHVGWIYNGREYSIAEALEIARHEGSFDGFIEPALRQMADDERPANWISPSMINKCLRQPFLKREVDYHLRTHDCWSRSVGTAIHDWLSRAIEHDPDDVIKELRLKEEMEFDGVPLIFAAQADRVIISQGKVIDFKTKKSLYRAKLPDPDHVGQVNLYAHMLRKHGYTINSAEIWYATPSPITRKDENGDKYFHVDTLSAPVEMWPDEGCAQMLQVLGYAVARIIKTGELPPAYSPSDPRAWQCNYCPVADECARRALSET
jgi:CRISPR/Cas system-associated exonuclease Cas4 (RecB family)